MSRQHGGKRASARSLQQEDNLSRGTRGGGVAIIHKIKERALEADPTAMRLCIERLVPLAKSANARFRMPPVATAADLGGALSALTGAVSEGELSAQEGEAVARMVESQRRNFEAEDFDARLTALEEASPRGSGLSD